MEEIGSGKGQIGILWGKVSQSLNGFAWVPGLSDLLEEYARDRNTNPNLDAFVPRIAKYLEEKGKK